MIELHAYTRAQCRGDTNAGACTFKSPRGRRRFPLASRTYVILTREIESARSARYFVITYCYFRPPGSRRRRYRTHWHLHAIHRTGSTARRPGPLDGQDGAGGQLTLTTGFGRKIKKKKLLIPVHDDVVYTRHRKYRRFLGNVVPYIRRQIVFFSGPRPQACTDDRRKTVNARQTGVCAAGGVRRQVFADPECRERLRRENNNERQDTLL